MEVKRLEPGMELVGEDAVPVKVEAVRDTGEWQRVYNLRGRLSYLFFGLCGVGLEPVVQIPYADAIGAPDSK